MIGSQVRRVGEAAAWAAVAAVTAANDLGVFDLRWADKGRPRRARCGPGGRCRARPARPDRYRAGEPGRARRARCRAGGSCRARPGRYGA